MQDVGFFDVGSDCPDLVIENGDLKADNGLETAALITLYSDRIVTQDQLPPGLDSLRGWWADLVSEIQGDRIGSRLWTLERSKTLEATAIELESILEEAFDWMLDDGVAQEINVSTEIVDSEEIKGAVEIARPTGDNIPLKFLWDGQALKLLEN